MKRPKVFIASSSEGIKIANSVKDLLLKYLDNKADVIPWPREFELSFTYIESLEKASGEYDFAILVMTPDDITTSREQKKPAPRDNVVFELGLFMGCLGRERCFIVHEEKPDLKLPTDLLGIKTAKFTLTANRSLGKVLELPCQSISKRISELGTRYKLDPEELTKQTAIRDFCELIEGSWWERINKPGINAISYFRIKPDILFNTVIMSGKSFDKNGSHIANWKSLITRVEKDEFKILYHWEGWHTVPKIANIPFHGFGHMEFDKPAIPGNMATRGTGRFWDVDEAHPQKTVIKPIEFQRIVDEKTKQIMDGGKEKDIRLLVKKTLKEW